ncbi:MAG TPA: YwiC-like family protein, partial [Micromonosporaceae bacterium]
MEGGSRRTSPPAPRSSRPAAGGADRRGGRSRWRRFLPPQHGAWAMLLVPFLAGLIVAGPAWVDIPLFVAWLAGYLWSYYIFQAIKIGRLGRYRDQLAWYGAVTVPPLLVVVWARPVVLWFAPVYAVLLAVNAWYAWRRRERALVNDAASV